MKLPINFWNNPQFKEIRKHLYETPFGEFQDRATGKTYEIKKSPMKKRIFNSLESQCLK